MTAPATKKPRRSRAQIAADKAAAEQARREQQSEANAQAGQPEATPDSASEASAPEQTAPQPAPSATGIDLGAREVTHYWPKVTIGGQVLECPHKAWGHQTEGAAQKCAHQLAAQHGAK